MLVNYILIKYSEHPLLIHLRSKTDIYQLAIYSFMSGLSFVALPLVLSDLLRHIKSDGLGLWRLISGSEQSKPLMRHTKNGRLEKCLK